MDTLKIDLSFVRFDYDDKQYTDISSQFLFYDKQITWLIISYIITGVGCFGLGPQTYVITFKWIENTKSMTIKNFRLFGDAYNA